MDKQIVDIDGRKVVRVNDLRLDEIEGTNRLVAVDVGTAGLLRRLGLERAYRRVAPRPAAAGQRALHRLGGRRPGRDLGRVDQAARARTPASRSCTRPTSRRSSTSSAGATAPGSSPSLDDEAAAEAIEEMEPETQVEVLEDLAPERAADILEEMSPDDAADLVADLSETTRARDPRAHGAGRGRRGPGAARLPRGHAPAGS